jgi:anti-anti-sigma regulatory factor
MSSRGLRGLTLASRKATELGVAIVLAAPNAAMREILAISRYDLVFKVFDSVDAALAG